MKERNNIIMAGTPDRGGALEGVRVVDLTDHRGELAGRLLADLGAEVLKIEPPEGAISRSLPPFDSQGESLFWRCYGLGKTCCRLNLEQANDRSLILELVANADVVLASFDAGEAARLGVDDAVLRAINPRLVHISISAYGLEGPKARWPASSLTLEAAGGRLSIQGDPDRPPLPVGYPQAWLHASAQAAADVIIALNEREQSRLGQFLDLSAQEAMWWTLMAAQGYPVCLGDNPPGVGDDRATQAPVQGPRTVAASDGLVTIAPGGSPPGTKTMFSFAIDEANQLGDRHPELDAYDWDQWALLVRSGAMAPEHFQTVSNLLDQFIARRTKLELVEWALHNNLRLGPLHTTADLIHFPQYLERGFFQAVGGIVHPATWVHMSGTPVAAKPVRIADRLPVWRAETTAAAVSSTRSGNAFEGLRVADFSWVAAGPTIGKALADHGATVVKIESETRPDLSRTLPPYIDGEPGLNRSYWSFLYATSKLSLQCNLATPAGRKLARQMCDWADVVIESFSPGTMARMGLSYEELSAGRPELIMLSTSMLGQTGAFSQYAGFGQQASGFCGFHYVTGWPDRVPCGVAMPYTDVVAPKFGIAALSAAIFYRRRTGIGQHVDLAQAECSMLFMAPLLMDEIANGRTAERCGFDSPYACPQGVYATRGIERYVAIAVETTEQWDALTRLIGGSRFGAAEYQAFDSRWRDRQAINDVISAWARQRDAYDLEQELVRHGIPVSVVQRPLEVFNDPQLQARGIRQSLPHQECGDVIHYGFCTRFSAKPQMVRMAPPCLGQHNDYVLRELLELPESEIDALTQSGALH